MKFFRMVARLPTIVTAVIGIALGWSCERVVAQTSPASSWDLGSPTEAPLTPVSYFPFQDSPPASPPGETAARPPVPAAPITLSNAQEVTAAIDAINADATLDPIFKQRLLESLATIQAELKTRQTDTDRLAAIEKSLSGISAAKESAKRDAAREIETVPVTGRFLPIERVREKRTTAADQLAAAQQELQRIDAEIAQRKSRIEKLPSAITAARTAVDQLRESSVGEVNDDPTGRLRQVLVAAREAKLASAQKRLETLQREQALLESQTDLLPLQKQAQEKRVAEAEAFFRSWSSELQKRRQSEIEKDLAAFRDQLAAEGRDPDRSLIVGLAEQWIQTVGETERVAQQIAVEKAEAIRLGDELKKQKDAIENNLARGGGLPSSLGLTLQLLKSKLPTAASLRSRIQAIIEQIESSQRRQTQLELTLEGLVDQSSDGLPIGAMSEVAEGMQPVSDGEANLVQKFISDLSSHQNKLLELQTELETQRRYVEELNALIDKHVVWIKNQPTFGLSDLPMAWNAFRWILQPSNLMLVSRSILAGLAHRPELALVGLIAILAIAFAGERLRRRISQHGVRAKSRQSVSLRPTLAATLLSWALVLPLVTLLYVIGEAITASGGNEALLRATAMAFHVAAWAVLPIELLRQCLRPEGLAVAHFDADDASLVNLRRWLRFAIDLGTPLVLLYIVAKMLGRSPEAISLARTTLVAGMLLNTLVIWKAFEPARGIFSTRIRQNPSGWLSRLRYVWFAPLAALPLTLAIVSLLGYGEAASVLMERLYWTLWLSLAAYFISGLMRRWLLTQRRRLTLAIHRERLEESERIGMGGVELEPTSNLGASEINAQTTRLTQTFLIIATIFGIALIWWPVVPAVQYLEWVKLWDIKDSTGQVVRSITLANLVFAVPILVLTWASVRNLPGLVEGVLLERLPLDKPARYAITTLGTYALAIIGLMIGAQTLGVRWDNIQWLVAALGVGLGFGLQEIFANFISGLILLFEQPIRVGDVVTLGDTTGVVARIRMRATTVTNWDRQELIIPNKDLITGRLVNWTLSDSTNRITLKVGIAYGSDTESACDLLREICHSHPNIVEDPPPIVTFDGFGDSTLDLVVRCFLATLDNRLITIHELHTQINRRFNDAGIEIAFPQRDLHLRTLPPELVRHLTSGGREADPPAEVAKRSG